ncbi:MAG: aminotransferase, partial [Lachnospiraceae bacterium]|nr:aminotransferase [Lachnospiraceae bacterium]
IFPKIDLEMYPVTDDQQFALRLLKEQKVLIVQGTGFNWPQHDHFRVVYLPRMDELKMAVDRLRTFLENYRK